MMLSSFGQVCATMLHWDMHTSLIFNTEEHGATRRNRMAKRAQCCTQQCCDMLRSNVAIVWLELANVGPTMLGCVLKCCDRLARG